MKAYRANRSFGAMQEGDQIEFEDGDPVLESLLGTGYLDLVEQKPSAGIPSEETFGVPTISQEEPRATKGKGKSSVQ